LAHEILEKTETPADAAVIGIRRRGAVLAERLAGKLEALAGHPFPLGVLDISLYQDDLSTVADHPVLNGTSIPFSLHEKTVILVDDVLYTGRTTLAALRALFDLGNPASVTLCVLIDRGHRQLPVEAAYVGRQVETTEKEIIEVKVDPIDGEERVLLVEKVAA
jgi:pyrimidine operon attenuation protein/uracil phosphoribosyltransferase